jgi:hypothetical protein
VGYEAWISDRRTTTTNGFENLHSRDHLIEPDINGRIILNQIFLHTL